MKKLKLFILLVLVAVSLFCFSSAVPTLRADHNPTWWDYDWNQRLEYTVNYTLVDEDLVNFPVLIYIDESVVDWGDVQNDLDDIRFTGDYLDELDFEIDSFILNSEAWFWVRLPEVSSSLDTYFFMYFDNKFCVSGENAEAVWDEYTIMVQHMNDATTSTILDSTSNNNDGTKEAANTPIESDGKIGKCQEFDASNTEYINFGDILDVNATESITLECWVEPDGLGLQYLISKGHADGLTEGYYIQIFTSLIQGKIQDLDSSTKIAGAVISADVWHHITMVVNRDDDTIILYRNGAVYGTPLDISGEGDLTNMEPLTFGAYSFNFDYGNYDGKMDESRVTNGIGVLGVRSSAWVKASYYSGTLELVYEGYHTGVSYARRGEVLAAALVASLILVPLLILVIFAARRKR